MFLTFISFAYRHVKNTDHITTYYTADDILVVLNDELRRLARIMILSMYD